MDTEPMAVKVSVACDSKEFSTDSELIPMRSRSVSSFKATQITPSQSILFILKKRGENWLVVKKIGKVFKTNSPFLLSNTDRSLELSDEASHYMLTPGTYRFVLLLNSIIDRNSIQEGDEYTEQEMPVLTLTPFSVGDCFLGVKEFVLEKATGLEQSPGQPKEVLLPLKRHSALLRMIIEGDELFRNFSRSVQFMIKSGSDGNGINLLGEDVSGILNQDEERQTTFRYVDTPYLLNNKNWYFATVQETFQCTSMYVSEKAQRVNIEINSIWSQDLGSSLYEPYRIDGIELKKNCITTIVLSADGSAINKKYRIKHEINPDVTAWDTDQYPPFNYIELNNN